MILHTPGEGHRMWEGSEEGKSRSYNNASTAEAMGKCGEFLCIRDQRDQKPQHIGKVGGA